MLTKKITIIFSLLVLTLYTNSCKQKVLLDLKEFNVSETALKDGEEIEILCSSENPENGEEEYYIHMIVKSLESNDTVNLLFKGARDVSYPKYTNYLSPKNDFYKIMVNQGNIKDGDNVKNLKVKNYSQVYSNPEYITLDWKKYPSTIGFAAKSFDNKQVDEIIDESIQKLDQ